MVETAQKNCTVHPTNNGTSTRGHSSIVEAEVDLAQSIPSAAARVAADTIFPSMFSI